MTTTLIVLTHGGFRHRACLSCALRTAPEKCSYGVSIRLILRSSNESDIGQQTADARRTRIDLIELLAVIAIIAILAGLLLRRLPSKAQSAFGFLSFEPPPMGIIELYASDHQEKF
jgi:hypothetical protein